MKINLKQVLIGLSALSLFACSDKAMNEPLQEQTQVIGGAVQGKPLRFAMTSSLGFVTTSREHQSPTTDALRADINFRGELITPTMSLLHNYFGERMNGANAGDKLNARWGVLYGADNKSYAVNCTATTDSEPQDANSLTDNTLMLKDGAKGASIRQTTVKMFCQAQSTLQDIRFGYMCLDGVEGQTEATKTRQYFNDSFVDGGQTYNCQTNPNARLQGLTDENPTELKRHIPIMTPVVLFERLVRPTATTQVKLRPRGSFIGLYVENKLGEDITLTDIVVQKDGVFDYAGYFDWSGGAGEAKFHGEAPTSQTGTKEYTFSVYKGDTAGYLLTQGETKRPCFFLWGFQKADKEGANFKVKVRYTNAQGTSFTTKAFAVKAPKSKRFEGKRLFDDGFAYKTILSINADNYSSEVGGSDWETTEDNGSTGGEVETEGGTIVLTNHPTPLDYVAEYSFQQDHRPDLGYDNNLSTLNRFVINYEREIPEQVQVGSYSFDNYNRRPIPDKIKVKYYIPSLFQWAAVIPTNYVSHQTITFGGTEYVDVKKKIETREPLVLFYPSPKKVVVEKAQIGLENEAKEYNSEFISVIEGSNAVTYAIRFKGTKWESAWRYSSGYIREASGRRSVNNSTKVISQKDFSWLLIRCVPLKANSGNLQSIQSEQFFNKYQAINRFFPYNESVLSNIENGEHKLRIRYLGDYGVLPKQGYYRTDYPDNRPVYIDFKVALCVSSYDAYVSYVSFRRGEYIFSNIGPRSHIIRRFRRSLNRK